MGTGHVVSSGVSNGVWVAGGVWLCGLLICLERFVFWLERHFSAKTPVFHFAPPPAPVGDSAVYLTEKLVRKHGLTALYKMSPAQIQYVVKNEEWDARTTTSLICKHGVQGLAKMSPSDIEASIQAQAKEDLNDLHFAAANVEDALRMAAARAAEEQDTVVKRSPMEEAFAEFRESETSF